jgi:hypothetical protein
MIQSCCCVESLPITKYNAAIRTEGMDAQKAKVAILISYKLKWSHLFVYAPGVFLRRVDDA